MKVTRRLQGGWASLEAEPLYSTHTVGLYIMISVPSRGLTLIWDKHTRLTVILDDRWRVSRLYLDVKDVTCKISLLLVDHCNY